MMWTSQRGAERSSQVWIADFVMSLDRLEEGQEAAIEASDARPEELQVQDPDSGLFYLYNPSTHELRVYNMKTHEVREPKDKAEIDRAMALFRR